MLGVLAAVVLESGFCTLKNIYDRLIEFKLVNTACFVRNPV